jgi:outer membrane lipoprotein-sorting protein
VSARVAGLASALTLLCLPALAAFAATASAAPPEPAFAQLLALLAARRHGHVSFTEVHEMAMLKAPLTSSGELLYEAPDRLEKRTLTPRAETLVLDHGILTAQRGQHRHVLELSAYPQVVPFVESIRATLAGDRFALERYFNVDFQGELAHWTLHLTPKDPALAHTVKDITIKGEGDMLHTVVIRQSDGDRSLITIGPEITP